METLIIARDTLISKSFRYTWNSLKLSYFELCTFTQPLDLTFTANSGTKPASKLDGANIQWNPYDKT